MADPLSKEDRKLFNEALQRQFSREQKAEEERAKSTGTSVRTPQQRTADTLAELDRQRAERIATGTATDADFFKASETLTSQERLKAQEQGQVTESIRRSIQERGVTQDRVERLLMAEVAERQARLQSNFQIERPSQERISDIAKEIIEENKSVPIIKDEEEVRPNIITGEIRSEPAPSFSDRPLSFLGELGGKFRRQSIIAENQGQKFRAGAFALGESFFDLSQGGVDLAVFGARSFLDPTLATKTGGQLILNTPTLLETAGASLGSNLLTRPVATGTNIIAEILAPTAIIKGQRTVSNVLTRNLDDVIGSRLNTALSTPKSSFVIVADSKKSGITNLPEIKQLDLFGNPVQQKSVFRSGDFIPAGVDPITNRIRFLAPDSPELKKIVTTPFDRSQTRLTNPNIDVSDPVIVIDKFSGKTRSVEANVLVDFLSEQQGRFKVLGRPTTPSISFVKESKPVQKTLVEESDPSTFLFSLPFPIFIPSRTRGVGFIDDVPLTNVNIVSSPSKIADALEFVPLKATSERLDLNTKRLNFLGSSVINLNDNLLNNKVLTLEKSLSSSAMVSSQSISKTLSSTLSINESAVKNLLNTTTVSRSPLQINNAITNNRPIRVKRISPPIPILPLSFDKEEVKKDDEFELFVVDVRKKGKFIELDKTYKEVTEAFKKGAQEVSNTARATFRVRRIGRKEVDEDIEEFGRKFASQKEEFRLSKDTKRRGEIIERRQFRISTQGEIDELRQSRTNKNVNLINLNNNKFNKAFNLIQSGIPLRKVRNGGFL